MATRALGMAVCGLGLLGLAVGCGEANPQNRRAISGKVALDGTPVKSGSIRFQAEKQGGISSGAPVLDGKYSIPTAKGLPPGRYKVMIFSPKPGGGQVPAGAAPGDPVTPAADMVPPEYNERSDKFVEVADKGPNEFNFEIATKK